MKSYNEILNPNDEVSQVKAILRNIYKCIYTHYKELNTYNCVYTTNNEDVIDEVCYVLTNNNFQIVRCIDNGKKYLKVSWNEECISFWENIANKFDYGKEYILSAESVIYKYNKWKKRKDGFINKVQNTIKKFPNRLQYEISYERYNFNNEELDIIMKEIKKAGYKVNLHCLKPKELVIGR